MRTVNRWILLPATATAAALPARGTVYLTPAQAQQAIFPGETFAPSTIKLGDEQVRLIETRAGVPVRLREMKFWRASGGGFFLVDEVLGKHDFITYAVGLTAAGAVKQVEILEYRENFGQEIRNERWRRQFAGKRAADPVRLDEDIKNISGATLSCRHLAEGVKRLLVTHDVALRAK